MHHKLLTSLLATCLVVAQLFMAAHALDADTHADGEACETCVVSANLELAPGSSNSTPPPSAAHRLPGESLKSAIFTSPAPVFLARAPPHTPLYR